MSVYFESGNHLVIFKILLEESEKRFYFIYTCAFPTVAKMSSIKKGLCSLEIKRTYELSERLDRNSVVNIVQKTKLCKKVVRTVTTMTFEHTEVMSSVCFLKIWGFSNLKGSSCDTVSIYTYSSGFFWIQYS